jgi:ubiquitin-like 1-activating enzyme E1 B
MSGLQKQQQRFKQLLSTAICSEAKVLMVGAGGIGCELLKTLTLTGFKKITIIDMDTIDVSNLNRQFLFRKKHLGQSKACVAKDTVDRYYVFKDNDEKLEIEAFCANVKDGQLFGLEFFKEFDIVLNGLDNLEARRHVNRMCLSANKPLVESGTTGYKGQVTVHSRAKTCACFECAPKPVPKSFPICTLRDTPSTYVHTIVFATDLLFPRLFGENKASDLDEEEARDAFTRKDGEDAKAFAKRVFEYVFEKKIKDLLEREDMWKNRDKKPNPLDSKRLLENDIENDVDVVEYGDAHEKWSMEKAAKVFIASAGKLFKRNMQAIEFDKDDEDAVAFVTATAQLRCSNYDIEYMSRFDAKGVAGNIVHALATTNAIVSGLIVIEALKLLNAKKQLDSITTANNNSDGEDEGKNEGGNDKLVQLANSRYTFVGNFNQGRQLLQPLSPDEQNPKCVVCGNARAELCCDMTETTLADVISKVLKKKLNTNEPSITKGDNIIHEEGDDLDEDENEMYAGLGKKTLVELGLESGGILNINDNSQDLEFDLVVVHKNLTDFDEEKFPEGFELRGETLKVGSEEERNEQEEQEKGSAESDDDIELIEEGIDITGGTKKRKRDDA